MTIDHQQVGPAIVVIIEKPCAPANVGQTYRSHFGGIRDIGEGTLTVVVIESVVIIVEVRDEQIEPSVVIIIAERHTHAALFAAVFVYRHAGGKSNLLKRAISVVVIEKVRRRVVRHKNVHKTIVVKITRNHAQAVI